MSLGYESRYFQVEAASSGVFFLFFFILFFVLFICSPLFPFLLPGRAKCKQCGDKIERDDLRIGYTFPCRFGDSDEVCFVRSFFCLFEFA
jgi:hypothetical protein